MRRYHDRSGTHSIVGFRAALSVDAVRQALKMTGPAMPKSPATDLATNKPAAESKDPDREVAEWVLSLPGGVNVMVLSERAGVQIVSQAADLPSDSFQVQGIFIGQAARVSDKDLALIGQCPSLSDLGVFCSDNSGITDAGIESLGHSLAAKSLRKLVFHSRLPNVSNASVSHLNRLSQLGELYVLGQFSNDGLEKLNLPQLKSLRFVGPKIDINGFANWHSDLPISPN